MTIRQVMEILNKIDYLNPMKESYLSMTITLESKTLCALRKFLEECVIRGKVDE